jgi:hypothetical protein
MEKIPSIQITLETAACFIERRSRMSTINRTLIGQWLHAACPPVLGESAIIYPEYVRVEVVSASNHEDQVWEVISNSEHVWCQSYFMGESATLFIKTLDMAIQSGTKDKCFFDLAERADAISNLLKVQQDIKSRLNWLEVNRNIKFFFWEEIWHMGATMDMFI